MFSVLPPKAESLHFERVNGTREWQTYLALQVCVSSGAFIWAPRAVFTRRKESQEWSWLQWASLYEWVSCEFKHRDIHHHIRKHHARVEDLMQVSWNVESSVTLEDIECCAGSWSTDAAEGWAMAVLTAVPVELFRRMPGLGQSEHSLEKAEQVSRAQLH